MNLLSESLWRDEAFSALLSAHNPLDIIRLAAGDATPPLHYLILHFWTLVFGNSEISMRLMTLGFFGLSAVVMVLIGRHIDKKTGWWLGALALTQPLLFQYGFEARAYSQLVLLSALTIYLYLTGRKIPLFIAATALLYTHLFGLWIVGILILWALAKRQLPWALGLAVVVFLPWIPSYLSFAHLPGGWLSSPNPQSVGTTLILLGAPLLVLVLPVIQKLHRAKYFWLALALSAVPIIGSLAVSQFKPLFLERYLLIIIPGELLLVGLAGKERYFSWGAGLAVLVQAIICWHAFTTPTKAPFRELASYISSHTKPGDLVINGSSLTYFEAQYYHLNAKIYAPSNDVPYYVGKVLIPPEDILTSLVVAKRYWLINLDEPGGSLNDAFPAGLVSNQDFGRLKLSLYEAKP